MKVLEPGQKLRDTQYGPGVVLEADPEYTTIRFRGHGIKKYITSLLNMELVEAPRSAKPAPVAPRPKGRAAKPPRKSHQRKGRGARPRPRPAAKRKRPARRRGGAARARSRR